MAFGVCHVCPIEAMYNAEVHLRRAEATGNLDLISQARVVSLKVDSGRRVREATYIRPGGEPESLAAPMFVLAAHTIESIRLLLLSRSDRFPAGLANSSGTLGRYFMEHWATGMSSQLAQPLYPQRIGFNTAHTLQFYDTPRRHRIGAMKITFSAGSHDPATLALESGLWGLELKKHLRETYGRWLAAIVNVEQLPREDNRITLDPDLRDDQGYAAPRIHLSVSEYERRTLREGRKILIKILHATGATIPAQEMIKVRENEFHPIAHHMGGCRMGTDANTSVVDSDLKAHDLDNLYIVGSSVFPTGGAMNPTLTLAALALRTAEKLKRRIALGVTV
jgi:choline dehydrogenase-like flavoprotein